MVSTIGQGLLWAILSLGIFMTFRILNFPDMTAEGSFPLGGAVCVTAINYGLPPILSTILGIIAGMLAGLVTGLLYTKGKVPTILAGILVMTSCNSVMLFVMNRANLSLNNLPRLQDFFRFKAISENLANVILGLITIILLIVLLMLFFDTNLGQAVIATGDNKQMAKSLGIKTDQMELLILCISNGIIALSGALVCQNDGYADVSKGIGIIVIGLASLIIGEVIFGELTLGERLVAIAVGAILYQLLIFLVIKLGFDTNYLKIISALILAICLMLPELRKKLKLNLKVKHE